MTAVPAAGIHEDSALGQPERLHPLYLVAGLGASLRGAWGLMAGGVLLGAQGRWWLVAVIGVLALVVSVGRLFLKWIKLEYRVGPHEIRIDSGFLSRTSRAIPFDRVTDVDIEQGPLHRLLGLARVRFETGASAGAKNEDGVLEAISLDRAAALREHIRTRRSHIPGAVAEQKAEAPPLFAMDWKRVAIAGLFNFSLVVVAGLFGVSQTFGQVLGFDPFKRAFWIAIAQRAGPARDLIIAHQFIAIVGGALTLTLLGIATGMVRTALREHGFRLDRTETGLRRRRGLLTLTDVTIPARRVQAAIIASGPIRRAFGWCVVKLQSLAMDGSKSDHVVAPLARPEEAEDVLASLGWPAMPAATWSPVSRAYVTSFIAMLAPAMLVAAATLLLQRAVERQPLVLLWPGVLLITGAAAVAIAVRWLEWRLTRYALSDGSLFIESGWWRRRRAIVPVAKIQSIDLNENFWTRRFGICALKLGVAGGRALAAHTVPALRRADAWDLRNRLIVT
jgi:putative membrane protein